MESRKRTFKAIICDIDGTLIINRKDALPSKRVIRAIRKAGKLVHVGIASSRPLFVAKHIIEGLELSGLCILCGGSQIYNALEKRVVWEKEIGPSSITLLRKILRKSTAPVIIPSELRKSNILLAELGNDKVLQFWVHGVDIDELYKMEKALSKIRGICAHRIPSWKEGLNDLSITHEKASKEHGVYYLTKTLGLAKEDIIAVGDGLNDLPLFKMCGLRIAMGNAAPELKAVADYVAPPVEKDGIVDVIEKFIF